MTFSQSLFTQECHNFFFVFEGWFCRIFESWLTVFPFGTLNMSYNCLMVSLVSNEKSAINLTWEPLEAMSHFSLATFKFYSLSFGPFSSLLSYFWYVNVAMFDCDPQITGAFCSFSVIIFTVCSQVGSSQQIYIQVG